MLPAMVIVLWFVVVTAVPILCARQGWPEGLRFLAIWVVCFGLAMMVFSGIMFPFIQGRMGAWPWVGLAAFSGFTAFVHLFRLDRKRRRRERARGQHTGSSAPAES